MALAHCKLHCSITAISARGCRTTHMKVAKTAHINSTCTLTLQSTALRTLVLLMGWISIRRVRYLDTKGKQNVRGNLHKYVTRKIKNAEKWQ